MKATAFMASLTTLLVLMSLSVSADEAKVKPLGDLVGKRIELIDGKHVALYRHREIKTRAKAELGSSLSEAEWKDGEWRSDIYHFTVTGLDGKTEVIWKMRRWYSVKALTFFSHDVRMLDAYSQKDKIVLFYVDNGRISRDSFVRSAEGTWSDFDGGMLPFFEQARPFTEDKDRMRTIIKGRILSEYFVQLDYENGDMEVWEFKPGSTDVPTMTDHNDLKIDVISEMSKLSGLANK